MFCFQAQGCRGSCDASQPPPSALTKSTLASKRRCVMAMSLSSFSSSAVCHVITWQTALLENELNDIAITQRRFEASVLLVKALGGGWDASQLPQQP